MPSTTPTATNTLPRTRRPCRDHAARALLAVSVTVLGAPAQAQAPPPLALTCRLVVPVPAGAGAPVRLRFTLANRGAQALQVLAWGTPFEGWMSPYVSVVFNGEALPYRGAAVKRADPGREDYLAIAAGRQRRATVVLSEAFDLRRAGQYELRPQITLHDVLAAPPLLAPRPRAQHQALVLDCPTVAFTVPG